MMNFPLILIIQLRPSSCETSIYLANPLREVAMNGHVLQIRCQNCIIS